MGVVFLARDRQGREVAVKVIRPEFANDRDFRKRFRREVDAASRVTGAFTARVLDADADGNPPFLVTEFIPGPTLDEYLRVNEPLQGRQLHAFALSFAEALNAIHAAGLIHRDLKPSNLILAPTGPRIIDFGIARAADDTLITTTSVVPGTPAWMGPEQARGSPATSQTDIFAWGALVSYAALARPPFGTGAPETVLYRVVHEVPHLVGLPNDIRPIVETALEKEPHLRPSAAGLIARLLGDAATVPGAPTEPLILEIVDRTWGIPSQFAGKTRGGVLDESEYGRQDTPQTGGLAHEGAKRRRTRLLVLASIVAAVLGVSALAGFLLGQSRPIETEPTPDTRAASDTPGTSTPSPVMRRLRIPVIACPLSTGAGVPDGPVIPATLVARIPSELQEEVTFYSTGSITVLGLSRWACTGLLAANGNQTIEVYPPGDAPPAEEAGSERGITARIASPGTEHVFQTVCSLFPRAKRQSSLGECLAEEPAEEKKERLSRFVVAFEDPPGVAGAGLPSGGPFTARGAGLFMPGELVAYVITCTLEDELRHLCTAVVDDFLDKFPPEEMSKQGVSLPTTPAEAAQGLFDAWSADDRDAALAFGTEHAVDILFSFDYRGGGEVFDGCSLLQDGRYDCFFLNPEFGLGNSFIVEGLPDGTYRVVDIVPLT